ncbi:ABC-type transport system involved in multi-copper enzyme maturation permease subunit [Archangium gephyra]|uniref:ABC-type transport system involved in multi-copper enzyme maturation permease subunit n=1 Tax=Archangium gephyra TaxID=48 RepID=A0AAC8TIC0_9BACT|nr:ABC transporter permease [Archangium gephyra]AKJ06660.1 PilI [Archangium gephyra]REG32032.1 ABC-type transport system involved in multi-copper enzyme maturation permease subunit [Archangium gephyra]
MGPFIALALNGFREARRNRVTLLVAIFALAMLLSTTLVLEITVGTFDRVITDVGLGAMSLMLVLLAIFLSSGLISREIERRTIFLMVSKPLSRGAFLVGRLMGNMLTVTVLQLLMAGLFFAMMFLYQSPISPAHLAAVGMLWFELWVLSAVGFLMSSFSSQMVSAFVTVSVYFAGHLSSDIYSLASKSQSGAIQAVGKAVYYVLPDLSRFNYRPHATYYAPIASSELLSAATYGMAFTGVLVALAIILFNRRDFR